MFALPTVRLSSILSIIARSMKDWVYRFDAVTKAQWLKQMETDMKGTPLSSLWSDWWQGESLDPLIYSDVAPSDSIRLPDQLFTRPPKIVERIEVADQRPDEINKRVHESLAYGTQTLIFHALPNGFESGWLKGVHVEMVSIQVELDELKNQVISGLIQKLPSSIVLRIPMHLPTLQPTGDIDAVFNMPAEAQKRSQFVFFIPSGDNWTGLVAEVFNTLQTMVDKLTQDGTPPYDFLSNVIINMQAPSDYMLQIIQCRVLHLVWQNVVSSITKSDNTPLVKLEISIAQLTDETPDHFLIRASMSGLASSLSGTYGLQILPTSDAIDMYRRVCRNIHHLLHMESNMYRGKDPIAGAYVPDFYARKWTEEIWKGLRLSK